MRESNVIKDRKCNHCLKLFPMTAAQIKAHAYKCSKEENHADSEQHRTIITPGVGGWGS